MIDWDAIIKAESTEELKEAKLFLLREQSRLENERKDFLTMQEQFFRERKQFQEEMDVLSRKMVTEKNRLKEENQFFEKKVQILQNGFQQLDLDRQALKREKSLWEMDRKRVTTGSLTTTYTDLGRALFCGTSNIMTVRKRYRDLMKIFHPDNICGDADIVKLITREYENKKAE